MTTDGSSPPTSGETRPASAGGRERGPERGPVPAANQDLAAAVVIALFAALAVFFSIRLEVPGSIHTAPGLLPVIAGSTLFVMAAGLGARAIRDGAGRGPLAGLPKYCAKAVRGIGSNEETRRALLLVAMVTGYVLLVALVNFDLSLPARFFTLRVSSYEVISVIMVTWILKVFWQASLARCFVTALIAVEVLAAIFRYGFGIPMPSAY